LENSRTAGPDRVEPLWSWAAEGVAAYPRAPEPHAILGRALAAQGRFPEAIAEYQRAIELDPQVASTHNDLAIALFRVGDTRSAEVRFREAIRLDPRNPDYQNNLRALDAWLGRDPATGGSDEGRRR